MTTGVLHCDPHPGNMCVTPNGTIVLYDFGMMDTLPQTTVQGMRKIAFGLLNGSPTPDAKEIATRGDSVMEGLEMAGFLTPGANATAVRMVGEFLVRFFSDQAAGRATQDVTEQIDYELRSLLGSGAIAFPSAFTFVARAFTSVDGIAKSLRPAKIEPSIEIATNTPPIRIPTKMAMSAPRPPARGADLAFGERFASDGLIEPPQIGSGSGKRRGEGIGASARQHTGWPQSARRSIAQRVRNRKGGATPERRAMFSR